MRAQGPYLVDGIAWCEDTSGKVCNLLQTRHVRLVDRRPYIASTQVPLRPLLCGVQGTLGSGMHGDEEGGELLLLSKWHK